MKRIVINNRLRGLPIKLLAVSFMFVLILSHNLNAGDFSTTEYNAANFSEEMLITMASEYLGVDVDSMGTKSANASVCRVLIDELSYNLANTEKRNLVIWKVLMKDIVKEYSGKSSIRDYSIYIDSSTGELLEIHSICEKYGNSDTYILPTNDKLIDALSRKNVIVIDSTISCGLSFFDAMQDGDRKPDKVYEIIAYYNYGTSTFNQNIRPMWYVILRGYVPPYEFSGGGSTKPAKRPESTRNSMIIGVDGTTGKSQFAMSLPF